MGLLLSLPLAAADFTLAGRLERLTRTSLSIRMPDGRAVDALLPPAIAVPYGPADQVEITCAPSKPVYDALAGLHIQLLVKSLRLVRTATPQERAEVMALLSWQPGENLLYQPPPLAPRSPAELDRLRQVNLDYLSKMPDFVALETARRYKSDGPRNSWRLYDTIEDEIAVRFTDGDVQVARQNLRQNGKPYPSPYLQLGHQLWGGGAFGQYLRPLFDSGCPTSLALAAAETAGEKERLIYLFITRAEGCFAHHINGSPKHTANPARTGRILLDAARGNLLRYQEEAAGYPEAFGIDRHTITESWDYVKIGESTYLLPISAEFVVRHSDGTAGKVTVDYKNHRHFESAANITFEKDR